MENRTDEIVGEAKHLSGEMRTQPEISPGGCTRQLKEEDRFWPWRSNKSNECYGCCSHQRLKNSAHENQSPRFPPRKEKWEGTSAKQKSIFHMKLTKIQSIHTTTDVTAPPPSF
jgi:hypothetical protein